jgi:hypothetical protein
MLPSLELHHANRNCTGSRHGQHAYNGLTQPRMLSCRKSRLRA